MMYLENRTETETFLLFSFYFPQSFVPKQDAALSGFGGIQPAAAVGAHFMTMWNI